MTLPEARPAHSFRRVTPPNTGLVVLVVLVGLVGLVVLVVLVGLVGLVGLQEVASTAPTGLRAAPNRTPPDRLYQEPAVTSSSCVKLSCARTGKRKCRDLGFKIKARLSIASRSKQLKLTNLFMTDERKW